MTDKQLQALSDRNEALQAIVSAVKRFDAKTAIEQCLVAIKANERLEEVGE